MKPDLSTIYYKKILSENLTVGIGEAIFRDENLFIPANLQNYSDFWEQEILADHPHKANLLKWIKGVRLEEFLNSFTEGQFQGIKMHSYYPTAQQFDNYVPPEFEEFMNEQVQDWVRMGALLEWEKVRKEGESNIPLVVSPLGIEPSKPRALWDGRYVNEFCRDIPFSMDNASKVAEVAWEGVYFFKIDHKSGYLHVPIHEDSRTFFGVFWKNKYYVFAVLPFGWKSSPLIYHTLTEAVAMYLRTMDIPMLDWIDDMLGMTLQQFARASDEEQFQAAVRAMVVTSFVLFKAGYFLSLSKCSLIPEQFMNYLGIDCDSKHKKFFVPEKRVSKYVPLLSQMLRQKTVSFASVEQMVGKLVSLECAVLPGLWYTRNQYAAMAGSGIRPDARRAVKNSTFITVNAGLREEWFMWIDFLTQNRGAPWKTFHNVYVMADVASDASGRCYAGVVNFPEGLTKITAGEFSTSMLLQDIQVKEGEALRATLSMMVNDSPQDLQGKTLICKIDNQALKAVLEKKGTSHNLELNRVGKEIFWLTQIGQFHLDLEYVESKNNVADKFTRQSLGLEASLTKQYFMKVWDNLGPFSWDLMASKANVNKDLEGRPLRFFSRYYDEKSQGVDVFHQQLGMLQEMFCFPPFPMISRLLKHLESQKVSCVLLVPKTWAPWRNLLKAHTLASVDIAEPFNSFAFTITHSRGIRVPKKYPFAMEACYVSFE